MKPTQISKKPHYHGHRQRLKERFLKDPSLLPDYELLELILYWVYPRQDVKPQAKSLLDEHKTLKNVIWNTHSGGLGLSAAFQAIGEMARRMLLQEIKEAPLLNNAHRVIEYCQLTMAHLKVEQFRLFFLDRKYFLLADEMQQAGTLDQVSLYPREVIKRALELNAACLIMVHNHPSGDPTPSQADVEITKHLKNSLLPFTIRVIDHFIIGRHGYFSFREHGVLD
jgi:DNA repair protein RadC